MSLHRFFTVGDLDEARLSAEDLHHLRDVLRLRAGDEVVLADGTGRQAVARLLRVTADKVSFEQVLELRAAFTPDITLLQGLSRGPKMDLVVQKVTEVGVTRIVPLVCARSVVRTGEPGGGREARWRRIAIEAAKQSQRASVPRVEDPVPFGDVADIVGNLDHTLVPWEEAGGEGVGDAVARLGARSTERVGVVVGPEGGLERAEVELLVALGAAPVTLGGTVLRTETAGIVAVALVSYELGGLGGTRRE